MSPAGYSTVILGLTQPRLASNWSVGTHHFGIGGYSWSLSTIKVTGIHQGTFCDISAITKKRDWHLPASLFKFVPFTPGNCHTNSLQSLNPQIVPQTLAPLTTLLSRYQLLCEVLLYRTDHFHQESAWWSYVGCYCLWIRRLVLNPPRNEKWMAGTALWSQGYSFASYCLTLDDHLVERRESSHLPSWPLCKNLYLIPSKHNHHIAPGLQPRESGAPITPWTRKCRQALQVLNRARKVFPTYRITQASAGP